LDKAIAAANMEAAIAEIGIWVADYARTETGIQSRSSLTNCKFQEPLVHFNKLE